ncbi:hypothetical protein Godav_011811 [Gossypium davidsonii]|uniref:Uncharacterized protein n=1 Tax=Gossypium davidsonii TaxID=34287 RepID=A0A7J8RBX0_GOSDV|nr:hypothetical protein [Gossypium davidsonii]
MLHLSLIQQRLLTCQLSSLPLTDASNSDPNNKKGYFFGIFVKWVSRIVVGSSLGAVYWCSTFSFSIAMYRRKVFFNYEKRLRLRSPLETMNA